MKNIRFFVIPLWYVGVLLMGSTLFWTGCNPDPEPEPDPGITTEEVRYRDEVFQFPGFEQEVPFGMATTQGGEELALRMNIFQPPMSDTATTRPLVLLAHGGGFVGGDKATMNDEVQALARAGYVAATFSYRLIDIPRDSQNLQRGVLDATFDAKAAVRFFYRDATGANAYRIDTSRIFIGGYSAGAFIGLHYAYMNTLADIEDLGGETLLAYVQQQGGLEGSSGNPGFSSKIHGVINFSGALFDADWVDAGEPPLFSVHGTADEVVPIGRGEADGSGIITEGSSLIHQVAASVGITEELVTLEGVGHGGFFNQEFYLENRARLRLFLYELLQ